MLGSIRRGGRVLLGVAALSASAIIFRRAHDLLPREVSRASAGFVGLVTAAWVMMAARQAVFNVGVSVAISSMLLAAMLMGLTFLAGRRFLRGLCLFLATSIGVDTVSLALVLVGVADPSMKPWFTGWEMAASSVACMHLARAAKQEETVST